MKQKFNAKIVDRKIEIIPSDKNRFHDHVATLDGKDVEVIVDEVAELRTLNQNRYLWACYSLIGRELGYKPVEIHALFGDEYLVAGVVEYNGREVKVVESTTALTKKRFAEVVDDLHMWASDQDIQLPYPDEIYVTPEVRKRTTKV